MKRYQRGLIGWVDMLIYLGIAVVIFGVIFYAWNTYIIEPAEARGEVIGAQAKAKELQPTIDGLHNEVTDVTKQRDQAKAANKTLGDAVSELQQAFVKYAGIEREAQARSDAALVASQASEEAARQMVADQNGIMNRPRSPELCTGICAKAYEQLGKLIGGSAGAK